MRYVWCGCAIHIKELIVSWRGFASHFYYIQYTVIGGGESYLKVSVSAPYDLSFTCITIKLFRFQVQQPLPNNQVIKHQRTLLNVLTRSFSDQSETLFWHSKWQLINIINPKDSNIRNDIVLVTYNIQNETLQSSKLKCSKWHYFDQHDLNKIVITIAFLSF